MFIPLYDDNPLRTIETPYVTRALIVVTSLVFVVFQSGLVFDAGDASAGGFAVIPAAFLRGAPIRETLALIPEPLTFVTYIFLHGSWMHLLGNMLFLWVFGDNVEDAMGHRRFLGFYLLCGVIAGVAHAIAAPNSVSPLVGASGAIAGCLAAYLMLHPHVKLWVLAFGRIPLKISAIWAIGGWIAWQVGGVLLGVKDDIAWWAHIGGLASGAILIPFFRRPDVPLFDRGMAVTAPLTPEPGGH
jgi:membrane associated rhomboid family serine protease